MSCWDAFLLGIFQTLLCLCYLPFDPMIYIIILNFKLTLLYKNLGLPRLFWNKGFCNLENIFLSYIMSISMAIISSLTWKIQKKHGVRFVLRASFLTSNQKYALLLRMLQLYIFKKAFSDKNRNKRNEKNILYIHFSFWKWWCSFILVSEFLAWYPEICAAESTVASICIEMKIISKNTLFQPNNY